MTPPYMTSPLWRVRLVLLCGFGGLLGGPWAVSARADSPALSAAFGIAGRYRPGAWCPVRVTVSNPSAAGLSGQVQALADPNAAQNRPGFGSGSSPTLGAALFARPVTVSVRPGPQAFSLYARGLDTGRDSVTVRLVEGRARGDGRTLAQANTQDAKTSQAITGTAVSDTDLLLVGFGGDPGAFTSLGGQRLGLAHSAGAVLPSNGAGNAPPTAQVAEAGPADLPDKAAGYGGVDAFLLRSDAPLDALTEAQADALRGWVAGGGHLIVCGGADPGRFAASFYAGLLPATVGPLRPGLAVPGAGSIAALTLTPKALPGVRALRSASDGSPLIVTGPYGAGRVTLTAYDPTAKAFQSAAFGAPAFWRMLLTAGPAASAAVLPFVAAREENYHPNFFGGGDQALLSEAVMRGPSLDAPGTEVIGLFLLVYLVALVPANYLILKRLDRKELAWVTIPALVLLFAAGTFGVGYAAKGGAVFLNRASVVETTAGRREAGVYAAVGLFSPHRTSYDLALPGENALAAIPNPGSYGYRGGGSSEQSYGLTKFVQTPEGATLLDTSVNMWAMRAFDVQSTTDLGGTVDGALAERNGAVTGTVANHTPHALTGCVLLLGDFSQLVGDLAPGARLPVSLAGTVHSPGRGGLALPQAGVSVGDTGDIHARMRAALADYARSLGQQSNIGYSNGGQAPAVYQSASGEALLIGWSDDPALAGPAPRVDGRAVTQNDVALVIIHLPIQGAKIVAMPVPPPQLSGMVRRSNPFVVQQVMASRTALFGSISRASPEYRQAIDVRNTALIQKSLGHQVYLRGIINSAAQDVRSQTFAWRSAPSHASALIAVLHGPSYSRFPNMIGYSGVEVLVSGKLVMERATPQVIARASPAIELTHPNQVQIVH